MNQRSKRARDRKGAQNLDALVINTGGHVAAHSRKQEPEVKVPQKVTGDVSGDKAQGLAKASPLFKTIKEAIKPKDKTEEKKVIAEATETVVKQEKGEDQTQS